MRTLQQESDAPRFIQDAMVEEIADRLAFMRFAPNAALVMGDVHHALDEHLPSAAITHAAPDTIDEVGAYWYYIGCILPPKNELPSF